MEVLDTTFISDTELLVTVDVPTDAVLGPYAVRVTNPDEEFGELESGIMVEPEPEAGAGSTVEVVSAGAGSKTDSAGAGSTVRVSAAGGAEKVVGVLTVTPSTAFNAFGPPGGAFLPPSKNYKLGNSGNIPFEWAANLDVDWVDIVLDPEAPGEIAPGSEIALGLQLNAAAELLEEGVHEGALSVENLTSGDGDTEIPIRLTVSSATDTGSPRISISIGISIG